ncbi:MAG: MerR family transcriptional regulator [Clostridium sp.]|jgi:ubiquinone/menaquinone biosynthesis C-methylase UbiE/DNA-binding transcriptional MerR regulator|uniref:MerR family transcriptional regulator n=1 Tax=Clostridium sp. TaxID=1506 RepID=UPI0025C2AA9F|nr:MerR family transcriptional regulator [Clostridium sp.]MCH3963150.1 MerR family transcriptional regulator [Clostridium sp.]MCI1716387.1 MerR family transcriptional regulator [Clostridium sp.]MCI1800727.1 MerR family transcriptional regulator [Clostridium sp.]MCI1814618.1 MerR family transcriptional regulator [Clostridium sp.]MCI1871528.1 MerR family transcriptional regulator [Clostridium sp.]
MVNNKSPIFTTGEFSKKANVTLRTLRYYDRINLLKPCGYNKSGHRLYSKSDFGKLQKILTLKFIGLSLKEIQKVINYDMEDSDFKKSLEIQRSIMKEKINHMETVIKSIDEAISMLNTNTTLNWDKFINIINVINTDQQWMSQYENASNLRARIRIHELFSTNKEGWMHWFFDQLNIGENSSILELGCGDGELWQKNLDRIPEGWEIVLTDFSKGMIKDAKTNLEKNLGKFIFGVVDAQKIPFDDASFDIVIANNMLYHISNIDSAFSEIRRVLKPHGTIYASTVGKNHMKEMRDIINLFNSRKLTFNSWTLTENFQLENGLKKMEKWFKNINLKKYPDSLKITDESALMDYIFSIPGNKKSTFSRNELKSLTDFLHSEIIKNGWIYVTKDTGFFSANP